MSTDLNASFSEQYMNINTKMKKRFLRKPNISEATNEFIALAIQCEHSDQPAFAGHAYVGAAKCEASVGNFLGEAEHYLTAGRQFMRAEKKLKSLKFSSVEREYLEAAIGCFIQALNKYPNQSPLRSSILMELANDLTELNHKKEAVAYYEQALETITDANLKVMCLRRLLNLQMECGRHEVALEISNKICDSSFNLPGDILAEIQICRILLTLIVRPLEDAKPPSLKKLFADLMNDTQTNDLPINNDLHLKLQSIVICHNTRDIPCLVCVVADTKMYLTLQQIELLNYLTSEERLEYLLVT